MRAWLARTSVVLALLAMGPAGAQAPTGAPPEGPALPAPELAAVANPHGAADGCSTCHLPGADGATGPARSSAASCYTCHPEETHHPMEVTPTAVRPPANWPLEDGKITCVTCHVEPAHEGLAGTPSPLFRGGPYAAPTEFCYACHERTQVARTDPHHPAAPYATDDATCGACHVGVPARNAAPDAAQLSAAPEAACATCHPGEQHWGMPAHLGKAVPEDVRGTLPAEMPLLADGTIACFTCHDVHAGHAAGAVRQSRLARDLHDSALAGAWADVPADAIFLGTDADHPPMLARPLEDSALCTACHGYGPP